MIIIDNFAQVAAQIETERGITKDDLISAIEQALESACKRKMPEDSELKATIDELTGEAKIYHRKTVVTDISEPEEEDGLSVVNQIPLDEATVYQNNIEVGETIQIEVTPKDFGRLAAQTAKQVIIQRIREAEKNLITSEFKDKIGSTIIGTVQRIEGRNLLVNLGRIEAILTPNDQIRGERYRVKDKIKVLVKDVVTTPKGPQIQISRAHPNFLRCLFHQEIPEIQDGTIEIISVSRDAGNRAKVAVKSNNENIGAVGTCVGHMGGRIQSIIKEINNEKIDILEWNEKTENYIANSLKPAKIARVIITNEEEKQALAVVDNDQLSLAIGKSGVNVRLAVKLTNWKIDIMNSEEFAEKSEEITGEKVLSIEDKIQQDAEKLTTEKKPSKEKVEDQKEELTELEQKLMSETKESETETISEDEKEKAKPVEKITAGELCEDYQIKLAELMELASGMNIIIKSAKATIHPKDESKLRKKLEA